MSYSLINTMHMQKLSASATIKALNKIKLTHATRLSFDDSFRDYLLAALEQAYQENGNYRQSLKIARERLQIYRPVVRSNYGFVLLIAGLLQSMHGLGRSAKAAGEELGKVPFLCDLVAEPAAVYVLRQMARFKDCDAVPIFAELATEIADRFRIPAQGRHIKTLAKEVEKQYKNTHLAFVWD